MNLRINREIRAPRVRVIGHDGKQVGILTIREALALAEESGLDLVEVVPTSDPPVCKVINYGKFRYDQTKKEKEGKKSQHQIKVKEIKLKPNIDEHDFITKQKQARQFIEKGNKVKITCTFRGREIIHTEYGEKLVQRMCQSLEDIATVESNLKMMGKSMIAVLSPGGTARKKTDETPIKKEDPSGFLHTEHKELQ